MAGPDGALLRGAHWRNFLVKYPESNRMHKKMMALSALARGRRRSSPAVRRAIGRAQCNDAYWHGVFGGLYLPHLRDAIWRNLAEAEAALRQGEALAWEVLDLDGDGNDEIWIHSAAFSALVSPARGGAVEEYTVFARGVNYANTLTRRREAYHDLALERAAEQTAAVEGGAASIHDIEGGLRLDARPPLDADDRALFVDRVLPRGVGLEDSPAAGSGRCTRGRGSAARSPSSGEREASRSCALAGEGRTRLEKRLRFEADGRLTIGWRWDPAAARGGGPVRHRAVAGRARASRVHTGRGRVAVRHRDGRQVRARARSHPSGRRGHAPLAGGARRRERGADAGRLTVPKLRLLARFLRPAGRDRPVCAAFHVRIDVVDLGIRQLLGEAGHSAFGTARLDHLRERRRFRDGTAVRRSLEQIGRDRIAYYVLAVAPRAVRAVLPPALVLWSR